MMFIIVTSLAIISGLLTHGGVYDLYIFAVFLTVAIACAFLKSHSKPLTIICSILLATALIQLIPLPLPVHKLVSPLSFSARSDVLQEPVNYAPAAVDEYLSIVGWIKILAIIGFIYLAADYFGRNSGELLLRILFTIGFLESCYALGAYFFHSNSFLLFGKRVSSLFPTGSFVNKNHFGVFAAVTVLIGTYLTSKQLKDVRKSIFNEMFYKGLLWGLMTLVALIALLLSQSRGAFVSLACAIAVMLFTVQKGGKRRMITGIAIVCAAALGSLLFIKDLGTMRRLTAEDLSKSGNSRLDVWVKSSNIIRESPLIGIGPGSFKHAYEKYNEPIEDMFASYSHPHNEYVAFATDFGLPAAIAIILAILFMLYKSFRLASASDDMMPKAILSLLVLFLSNFLYDFNMRIPVNGFIFAIATGYFLQKLAAPEPAVKAFKLSCLAVAALFTLAFTNKTVNPGTAYEAMQPAERQAQLILSPLNYRNLMTEGYLGFKAGDIETAKKYFDLAYRAAPYNPDVNYYRGLLYTELLKREKSDAYKAVVIESVKKTVSVDCDKLSPLLNNTIPHLTEDDVSALFSGLRTYCYSSILKFIIERNRHELLIPVIDNFKASLKDNVCKQGGVGEVLEHYGQYDSMLYLFDYLDKNTPSKDNAIIPLYLARGLEGIGDTESAIKVYRDALQRHKTHDLYIEFAKLCDRHGIYVDEIKVLEEAALRFHHSPEIAKLLADTYYKLNMFDNALETYIKYVSMTRDENAVTRVVELMKVSKSPSKGDYMRTLFSTFSNKEKVLRKLQEIPIIDTPK